MPSGITGALRAVYDRSFGRPQVPFVAAVVGAALIWSTSFTVTKVALADLPPLTIGTLRFVLAAVVLGVVARAWSTLGKPSLADLGRMTLGGLLGTTVYFSMENVGVNLATASDAALLIAAYPAITMALEILVYRARASWVRFLGVGLAMLGIYLIIGGSASAAGGERLLGDFILVAAGVVWTLYNFATRTVGGSYPNTTVVFYQTAAGALAFVPLAFLEREQWQMPSLGTALIVVYLGLFCSVMAFLLYAYGLKALDSGSAVNLLNLVPVFGVVLAFLVLREPVGAGQLFGGLVVIAGVVLGLRSGQEVAPKGKAGKQGTHKGEEKLRGERVG